MELLKIPYPSHRILYDLIGFSRILSDPVGFHMIFPIILYDLFKNHLKFDRISVGSCAIAYYLVYYSAGSSPDLISIP